MSEAVSETTTSGTVAELDPREQALKDWLNTTSEGEMICRFVNAWTQRGHDVRVVGNESHLAVYLDLRTKARGRGEPGRKELGACPSPALGNVHRPRGQSLRRLP